MNEGPFRTTSAVLKALICLSRLRIGLFRRPRLDWRRRPQPDKSVQALAAIEDGELFKLSETGLRLRREARRTRSARRRIDPRCGAWLSAGLTALISATQVVAQHACDPDLAVKHAHLSKVQRSTSERKWTAAVSVDASRCAPNSSGHFELVFVRLKELGPELQFRERFPWRHPEITVEVAFWADEAVQRVWIENVTPCRCAP